MLRNVILDPLWDHKKIVAPVRLLTYYEVRWAGVGIMVQIAKIGDYITPSECTTTGAVEPIEEGRGDAIGQDPMSVDEIETDQGMMRIPADWLARLISPA